MKPVIREHFAVGTNLSITAKIPCERVWVKDTMRGQEFQLRLDGDDVMYMSAVKNGRTVISKSMTYAEFIGRFVETFKCD